MPTGELEAGLIDWYGEAPVTDTSASVVLWSSPQGETWTLVEYLNDGFACRIDAGRGWDGEFTVLYGERNPQKAVVSRANHVSNDLLN